MNVERLIKILVILWSYLFVFDLDVAGVSVYAGTQPAVIKNFISNNDVEFLTFKVNSL